MFLNVFYPHHPSRLVVLSWATWESCPRWGTRIPASLCCTTSACSCCSSTHNLLTSTLTSRPSLKQARCAFKKKKKDLNKKIHAYLKNNNNPIRCSTFSLISAVWLLSSPVQLCTAGRHVQSIMGTAEGSGEGWGEEERRKAERERGRGVVRSRGFAPSQTAQDGEGVRGAAEGPESRLSSGHQQASSRCSTQTELSKSSPMNCNLPFFLLKVPRVPHVPRLLPSHGARHQSGGLLQNHQQLLPGVQIHEAGSPPAEGARAPEGRGREPGRPRHTCGQEEVSANSSCTGGCIKHSLKQSILHIQLLNGQFGIS